jgi:hypothetical protein
MAAYSRTQRLVVLSCLLLTASLLAAAHYNYAMQPFTPAEFDISDLQWYKGNPDGYLFATIGPMLSMVVLAPMIPFVRRKYIGTPRLAAAGAVLFVITIVVLLHADMLYQRSMAASKIITTPVLLLLTHVSLIIILSFFIVPNVIGYNYPLHWLGIEPNDILGSCEILYLVIAYITLWVVGR